MRRINRVNKNNNSINNNDINQNEIKPLLKLKPKFNLLTALSSKHLGTLATLIFIGVLLVQTSGVNVWYFIAVLAVYIVYLVIRMLWLKKKYKKTAYLFFEDRLFIIKKYGRQEQTMIPYNDIADILFYQNYAQKLFGMGSLGVKISSGNFFNNIIMLESLEDLNGTIEKIRDILYA